MRKGFTLVELLVVIAIILFLIALLYPALKGVREAGYQATCVSNMRNLGMGLQAYANDHRGYVPHQTYWLYRSLGKIETGLLYPYNEDVRIYLCRKDVVYRKQRYDPRAVKAKTFTYVMNGVPGYARPQRDFSLYSIPNPSEVFLLMEEDSTSPFNDGYVIPYSRLDVLGGWHFEGGNLLYCDLSVLNMHKKYWLDNCISGGPIWGVRQ